MSIGLRGENLIFLISQPRAGSTLLQRILGSHPDIHTVSEPWLMLYPLYALRNEGYQAEYDAQLAREAMEHFLQTLPGGEEEYVEGVRRMYAYLYGRALEISSKRYFLDKTPRYYHIVPELCSIFPESRYIILMRHPLAVLSSILTWIKERRRENWSLLYRYRQDLVRAPHLLLEGIGMLGERGMVVHYEQLVSNPASEISKICKMLGIAFIPEMIEYGHHALPHWRLGDPGEVYQHSHPVSRIAEKWIKALEDPQVWRLANDYLQLLGQETIERMGYSYEELQQVVEAYRPHRIRLWFTLPLTWL